MIDKTKLDSRDKRGYWWPNKKISYGSIIVWPPQLMKDLNKLLLQ